MADKYRQKWTREETILAFDALRRAKKINPSFDGDCVLEEAVCCFSLSQEEKYILAALFNAPTTMGGYFRAEVNHDMPQLAEARYNS